MAGAWGSAGVGQPVPAPAGACRVGSGRTRAPARPGPRAGRRPVGRCAADVHPCTMVVGALLGAALLNRPRAHRPVACSQGAAGDRHAPATARPDGSPYRCAGERHIGGAAQRGMSPATAWESSHRARTGRLEMQSYVQAPSGLPAARHDPAGTPRRALGKARATRTVRCEVHSVAATDLLAVALPQAQQAHSAAPGRSSPPSADRVRAPLAGNENPRMGLLRKGNRSPPSTGAKVTKSRRTISPRRPRAASAVAVPGARSVCSHTYRHRSGPAAARRSRRRSPTVDPP
jgi:hypothetical protein